MSMRKGVGMPLSAIYFRREWEGYIFADESFSWGRGTTGHIIKSKKKGGEAKCNIQNAPSKRSVYTDTGIEQKRTHRLEHLERINEETG